MLRATDVAIGVLAWLAVGCDLADTPLPADDGVTDGGDSTGLAAGRLDGRGTLGRGYNVFGDYANPLEVTRPVLDYDALAAAGLIDAFDTATSTFDVFEGRSLEEYSRQMSASAAVSGSSGPFSGAIETNFAQGTHGRMEYSYATLQFLNLKRQVQVLETRPDVLRDFLTEFARRDLDDPAFPAGDLVDEYGSHVLVDVFLGGRLDYNMAVDMSDVTSSLSVGVAVQASFKGAVNSSDVSAELASDLERRNFEENASFQTIARGGRSEIVGNTLTEERVDAWLETIDDDPVLVAFSDVRPMVPLWELAEDPTRAAEIEAAFEAKSLGLGASLQDGPARFVVAVSMEVPSGRAADEGGNNLEMYGDVVVAGLTDIEDPEQVIQEEVFFDRAGGGDIRSIHAGETIELGTRTIEFAAFDESTSGLELASDLVERDPGPSADDDMGREVERLHFRTPAFDVDGTPIVRPLVGRHIVEHVRGGAEVRVIYDIQLLE